MADDDELLSADEIEALIQAARSEAPDGSAAGLPSAPSEGRGMLDAQEIEALMQGQAPSPSKPASPRPRTPTATESILQQAESNLAAAMAQGAPRGIPPELGTASAFNFQELGALNLRPAEAFPLTALQDVELDLRIELGRTELLIDEVLKLREGSVVPLDKLAGDPVDILVNGRLVARGEVLVLNDNFCVRVAEILTPEG